MTLKKVSGDRIRLTVLPATADEKNFCETVARLVLYNTLFLPEFCEGNGQPRLVLKTNQGEACSLVIPEEHVELVAELVNRQIACTKVYCSGLEAGCEFSG